MRLKLLLVIPAVLISLILNVLVTLGSTQQLPLYTLLIRDKTWTKLGVSSHCQGTRCTTTVPLDTVPTSVQTLLQSGTQAVYTLLVLTIILTVITTLLIGFTALITNPPGQRVWLQVTCCVMGATIALGFAGSLAATLVYTHAASLLHHAVIGVAALTLLWIAFAVHICVIAFLGWMFFASGKVDQSEMEKDACSMLSDDEITLCEE